MMGTCFLRIYNNGYLACVAGINRNLTNSRHTADERLQTVDCMIPQVRSWYITVKNKAKYRPNAWGEAFDFDLRLSREIAADIIHLALDQLQCVLHVHVGGEEDGDFAASANRSGA